MDALRHAKDEVAEKVASGHDVVGLACVGQLEGLADHAAKPSRDRLKAQTQP